MNKVPKIIHYCWFGGNPLPELAEKCIQSWKQYCPDYKIIRWDESNFDLNLNKYVKEAYEAKKWAFVSDVARLYVVHKYGGIYLDTDVELIKNIDDLLDYEGFMGFENQDYIATGLGFGASKSNKLVYKMLMDYQDISFLKNDGTYDLTPCPQRNTKVLINLGIKPNNKKQIIEGVVFLPSEFMNPKDYYTGEIKVTKRTYSIHHFSAFWHTEKDKEEYEKQVKFVKVFGKRVGLFGYKIDSYIKKYGFATLIKKMAYRLVSIINKKILS